MIPRSLARHAYNLLDRKILSRLTVDTQHKLVTQLLSIAKRIHPEANWPVSAESLLVRRNLREPTALLRTLPPWAIKDMQNLSLQVDPLLSPAEFLRSHPRALYAPTHWTQAGKAYKRILAVIGIKRFDTILFVPWLKRGGADLAALHHARLCSTEFGHRTLVISTEKSDSPWANRLPQDVLFVDAGTEFHGLSAAMKEPEIVLARLILQLAPTRIHIINSHTAWRMLDRFGLAIRQRTRIFASLYCDELADDGRAQGLAQRHLPTTSQWLEAVITDNSASPENWCRILGIRNNLFQVVHFPAPSVEHHAAPTSQPTNRVLWASRIERQKRPELLLAIVTMLKDVHWDIHGTTLSADDPHLAALARLDNVTLHGPFDRFQDIVSPQHRAYVYTTAWDGLPNVLLEAAAAGIPIVAPDIGGIRDLLPAQWLLGAQAKALDYVREIELLADHEIRQQRLDMQNRQIAMFTWQKFSESMRRVEGYAGCSPDDVKSVPTQVS